MQITDPKSTQFKYRMITLALVILFYTSKAVILLYQQEGRDSIEVQDDQKLPVERRLLLMNPTIPPFKGLNCTPLAIDNFPRDQFTQKQRRSGLVIFHIFAAAYMFLALAIVCDEYFIPCLKVICDVLRLQPDVAGATFMAAGSSAPELATTLVGVLIARDDIGLGAVVGSADFNVMFVTSVCALFSKEIIYLNWWPLVRDSTFYLVSIILLASVIVDEKVYWYEALILLLFYGFYISLMHFNRRLDVLLNAWCLSHRNICPRVLHDEVSNVEIAAQSSGKFGGKYGETMGLQSSETPLANYSRLEADESELINHLSSHEVIEDVAAVPRSDPETAIAPTFQSKEQLTGGVTGDSDPRTFAQICLAPLAFPPKGTSMMRWIYYILAWPIRFCLCLTTPDSRSPRWRRWQGHWIAFLVSCFWIGVFTIFMMWMIAVVGVTLGIPDTIMGLTFIAAGSSVPDAITSVIVVREGEGDMAISNAVGSNIFDILVCMGLPWLVRSMVIGGPVVIYSQGLTYATLTLFVTVLILLGATHLNRWRLTKPYGVGLMITYILFLVICSLYELNIFGMVHPPADRGREREKGAFNYSSVLSNQLPATFIYAMCFSL
ncbi:putative sodium/potassium/calcium exchanger [Echinococcus granulosus]|uniref:Sodium:potassium:calcium exchanger n=1 Tax=Echinococcus granulosus TaxID=6210 RepID=A0A068WRQ6_ECHGR|nr:putative sodium/potassium/calcium exchanger [Echinococcus granulosus]CDS22501.1 sodium:potassium:calcium exchanger [Echinococcus granulosus]